MKLELIETKDINGTSVYRHMTLAEASRHVQVSESTIRRHAKRAGVQRISGRTVAGGIVIDASPVPVCVTYSK